MALHPINPLLQLKAEFLLPHLDTCRLCALSEMFSLLWSLICYQSICKYHVIKREMRNSKGDFQYFLPLSTATYLQPQRMAKLCKLAAVFH